MQQQRAIFSSDWDQISSKDITESFEIGDEDSRLKHFYSCVSEWCYWVDMTPID